MGVVFAVAFFIGLLIFGFVPLILGVVGLIIGAVRKKNGKNTPKAIKPLSIVAIVIGVLIMAIPVAFFGEVFIRNATLREGVTITDIVIEERGYQDERFTADGVVYVVCDNLNTNSYVSKANAVFTYKYSDSILDRSQIGNYYSVENPYGFDLVCDDMGQLFCPESQYSAVIEHFNNIEGYRWEVYDTPFSEEASKMLDVFMEDPAVKGTVITIDYDDAESVIINKMSPDGLITIYDEYLYCALIYEGKVYYIRDEEFSIDDEEVTYTIVPMPPVIAEEILNAYNNYND